MYEGSLGRMRLQAYLLREWLRMMPLYHHSVIGFEKHENVIELLVAVSRGNDRIHPADRFFVCGRPNRQQRIDHRKSCSTRYNLLGRSRTHTIQRRNKRKSLISLLLVRQQPKNCSVPQATLSLSLLRTGGERTNDDDATLSDILENQSS